MAGEHQMGSMDISQHRTAYDGFIKATVWGCATVIAILALMALFLL